MPHHHPLVVCWPRSYSLVWLSILLVAITFSMTRPSRTTEKWTSSCIVLVALVFLARNGPLLLPPSLEALPCVSHGLHVLDTIQEAEDETTIVVV